MLHDVKEDAFDVREAVIGKSSLVVEFEGKVIKLVFLETELSYSSISQPNDTPNR